MASKHFLINPDSKPSSQQDVLEVEQRRVKQNADIWDKKERLAKEAFEEPCTLKHTFGRVIVKADLQSKNYTTFADGTKIRLERQYNNFNRRETQPVNVVVVSAEYIPIGSEILVSHNALHDSNKIFSYTSPSGKKSVDVQYYALPETDCFAWRDENGELKPMQNFEFGLRVFKPYEGDLKWIKPALVKDVLFITTGEFKGMVCHVLKASDYQIIFQGLDGKEDNVIRVRHSQDPNYEREEIIAISHVMTEQVSCGTLLIGLEASKSKTLKEYYD